MSGAWAAIFGAIIANTSKDNPPLEKEKLERFVRFKSMCGCFEVDFDESYMSYLDKISTGKEKINHKGIEFKLLNKFSRDELGNRIEI